MSVVLLHVHVGTGYFLVREKNDDVRCLWFKYYTCSALPKPRDKASSQ